MLWIIAIAALAVSVVGPILWSIFVHPLRSAATVLKLLLGVAGILYLVAGLMLGNFGNGALGVVLLIGASGVSAIQARHA